MNKYPLLLIFILAGFCASASAQNGKTDLLKHKYLGDLKGSVINISADSVEFKNAGTKLIYEYPKSDIDYIILSTGRWISFDEQGKTFVVNSMGGWGYFILSGGLAGNISPDPGADIWKDGISFAADLNYRVNDYYSLGFRIGYDAVKIREGSFISNSGLAAGTGISGGTTYRMTLGLINRVFLLPSFAVSPVVSLFAGYGNLIVSEIEIKQPAGNSNIGGVTSDGAIISAGAGFKISTGQRSGVIIGADYNWFFIKDNRQRYFTLHIGYLLPIN